jgi:SAM-dependent methyltransferase
MTNEEIEIWHREELNWWNKFSSIMTKQWILDEYSNNILRKQIEEESFKFLDKKNGNLLDLGCGAGWLSFKYEKAGMNTIGVDFSEEQIKLANTQKKGDNNINSSFICTDILKWDYVNYINHFDSIHISAFLHHIPEVELEKLFYIISKVSKDNANIYLYEPIYVEDKTTNIFIKSSLFMINKFFGLMLNRLPSLFNCWEGDYKKAKEEGYTGMSPNESALEYEFLKNLLKKNNFILEDIRPIHYKSIGYAIIISSMKKSLREILKYGISTVLIFDKFLFKIMGWKNVGEKRNFLLCSIEFF